MFNPQIHISLCICPFLPWATFLPTFSPCKIHLTRQSFTSSTFEWYRRTLYYRSCTFKRQTMVIAYCLCLKEWKKDSKTEDWKGVCRFVVIVAPWNSMVIEHQRWQRWTGWQWHNNDNNKWLDKSHGKTVFGSMLYSSHLFACACVLMRQNTQNCRFWGYFSHCDNYK